MLASSPSDRLNLISRGGGIMLDNPSNKLILISRGGEIMLDENSRLNKALDGGDHYDDCDYEEMRRSQRLLFAQPTSNHPRQKMINKLKI